jgi:hypothetical protein
MQAVHSVHATFDRVQLRSFVLIQVPVQFFMPWDLIKSRADNLRFITKN